MILVNPATGVAFTRATARGGATTRAPLGTLLECLTAGGALTVRRPSPRAMGAIFAVLDTGNLSATNPITVDGDGDLIDGAASLVISSNGASGLLVYDGTQWRRLQVDRAIDTIPALLSLVADDPVAAAAQAFAAAAQAAAIAAAAITSAADAAAAQAAAIAAAAIDATTKANAAQANAIAAAAVDATTKANAAYTAAVFASAIDATTKANAAQANAIAAAAIDATTKANAAQANAIAASDPLGAAAAAQAASQPLDADLTAIAALTGQTAFGRSFLTLADAAAGRTALALGTAATSNTTAFDAAGAAAAAQAASQPLDADLTAIAALATTAYGRAFLVLADAAAGRTALALGTAATSNTTAFDAAGAAAAAQAASDPSGAAATAQAAAIASSSASLTAALARLTPLDANHLHAWELSDANGNFVDTGSSASRVNLTATTTTSAPVYAAPGIVGLAAAFGRQSTGAASAGACKASALVSAFSDLPLTNVTLEGWVWAETASPGYLFGVDNVGSTIFCLNGNGVANSIGSTVRATTFRTQTILSGFFVPWLGAWNHIALVYDTANSLTLIYLNGEIVSTAADTGNVAWTNGTTPTFAIARDQNSSGQFNGKIQCVRLSNIARSTAYMRAVYKKGMNWQ
jgi:hypothetical protein